MQETNQAALQSQQAGLSMHELRSILSGGLLIIKVKPCCLAVCQPKRR